VRQAIAYAIDYDSIVNEILVGFGERLYCAVLPHIMGSAQDDPNLIRYTYDPTKAKELLSEAGYPNGFTATLIYPSLDPVRTDVAIQVQSNLAEIGITVELEGQDWGTITESITGYDYDFIVYGWCGDYLDADTFIWPKMHSSAIPRPNYEHFSNATFDELMEEARRIADPEKRKELYWETQELANEEVVEVYIYYNLIMGAQREWVKDFYLTPLYVNYYDTVYKTEPK